MVKGSVALSVRRRPVPLLSATTGRISEVRGPNCTEFGKDIGQSPTLKKFFLDFGYPCLLHFEVTPAQRRVGSKISEANFCTSPL